MSLGHPDFEFSAERMRGLYELTHEILLQVVTSRGKPVNPTDPNRLAFVFPRGIVKHAGFSDNTAFLLMADTKEETPPVKIFRLVVGPGYIPDYEYYYLASWAAEEPSWGAWFWQQTTLGVNPECGQWYANGGLNQALNRHGMATGQEGYIKFMRDNYLRFREEYACRRIDYELASITLMVRVLTESERMDDPLVDV